MRITRDGDQIKIAFPGLDVAKLSDADKARLLAHIEEQKRPRSMSVRQSNGRGGSYDMVVGDETEHLPELPRYLKCSQSTEKSTALTKLHYGRTDRWKTDGKLCLTTTAHVQALLARPSSGRTGSPGG